MKTTTIRITPCPCLARLLNFSVYKVFLAFPVHRLRTDPADWLDGVVGGLLCLVLYRRLKTTSCTGLISTGRYNFSE